MNVFLSIAASKVMTKILDGMDSIGDKKTIKNSDTFTPLTVESIGEINTGHFKGMIYSLAHYSEQNGDLMADPEMTFLKLNLGEEIKFIPMSYTNHYVGRYDKAFNYGDSGELKSFSKALLKSLKSFSTMWLKNIKYQQEI
jgi:hypothetical protein